MAMRSFLRQWAPGLVLVAVGAGMAAAVGLEVEQAERARALADFRTAATVGLETIRDDATLALNRLEAVQAFWTAYPDASPADFQHFVGALSGFEQGGPIRAVALAPRIKQTDRDRFFAMFAEREEERRALGYPDFRLWPETDQDVSFPTALVEPAHARQGVLGYDMFSNASRRQAMLRAAGEGRVISSAPVRLTQDADDPRSSVLLVAPLYADRKNGSSSDIPWWHDWPDETRDDGLFGYPRRSRHVGYVAMGFSPSVGLADRVRALGADFGVSLVVWDGGSVTNVMRDERPSVPPSVGDPALFHASGSAFEDPDGPLHLDLVQRLDFAGRVWWVGFAGLEAFRPGLSRAMPFVLSGAVLLAALALAALSHRMMVQRAMLEIGVAARTTDLVRANTALRDSQARAEAANAAKTQFLSAMSHELRTPLNAIIGFAQMLRDGTGLGSTSAIREATVASYAGYILTAGESLLAQLGRVLDLSRIEAGRLSLSPEPLDLGALGHEEVAVMKPVADARAVRLGCEVAPDMPLAYADRQAVRQILENLLSNAIKFSPSSGLVLVRVDVGHDAPDRRMVRLTVSDEGIGIPPDQIDKVLEPFHQVADQMTRQHGGFGLGLAIVRDLVQALGGVLTIESEVGRGTRVQVLLPTIARSMPARSMPARSMSDGAS